MTGQSRRCELQHMSAYALGAVRTRPTFVEHGQDGFHIRMHFGGRRLSERKIALPYIAGAGPRDQRVGERLPLYVFVIGAAVNVDDVAHALFHHLLLCCGDQTGLVWGFRRASRTEGGCGLCDAKRRASRCWGASAGAGWAGYMRCTRVWSQAGSDVVASGTGGGWQWGARWSEGEAALGEAESQQAWGMCGCARWSGMRPETAM
jgi:hypothetical protein